MTIFHSNETKIIQTPTLIIHKAKYINSCKQDESDTSKSRYSREKIRCLVVLYKKV